MKTESKVSMEKKTLKSTLTFGVLCFLAGALVMIIYWAQRSNEKTESNGENVEYKNETQIVRCQFWELTNDGYCDDEANVEECNFDFGDCCEWENDFSLCQDCFCITSQINYTDCAWHDKYINNPALGFLGTGDCDPLLNTVEYFFDAGDCCLDTSKDNVFCLKSDNYCIPKEIGDGICQDHNNSPLCDYDLGDCCLPGPKDFCCECRCSVEALDKMLATGVTNYTHLDIHSVGNG